MTKTPNPTPQPNYPDQIIGNNQQPGAEHAVNAAPFAADLRGIEQPQIGSHAVNEASWAFLNQMPHQLPGPIFNALKPAVHAAICEYLRQVAKAAPASPAQQDAPTAQAARECQQQSAQVASDRDTHFYLAGWNGAGREVEANAHFNAALQAAPPAPQDDAALLDSFCSPGKGSKAARRMKAAPPAPEAVAVPVLYVSPEQLAKHSDPEGAESAEAGRYLPTRKTPAGKFTQPLYAAAPAALAVPTSENAAFEAWIRSQGYNTTKEGSRYCEGVVNALRDSWAAAQKEAQ